jgi:hypothetical protein
LKTTTAKSRNGNIPTATLKLFLPAASIRAAPKKPDELPPEFYDADGQPPWNQVALFCRKHVAQLHSHWEREFVTDMAGKTLWRQPSEKQAKHLLAIFIRLGGVYEPNGN